MQTKESAILKGPIWRALLGFFFPCWLGMVFQQLYNTVDTLIVGNYVGTGAVAAVGSVSIAVQVVIGICTSIANGAGVVIAQHYGAGETKRVARDARCSLLIALLSGAALTALCVPLSGWMVTALKTPADIAADSAVYLRVYFCALIPNLLYNFGTAILRGMGDSKRPLYILIAASAANIALDLLFVIVFRMGVFGVALATGLSQLLSAVLVLLILLRALPQLRERSVPDRGTYRGIFRLGLPAAVQSVMYSGSNVLIQMAINSFGTAVVAAWSIYGKVDCISWMTMSSMGMAVTAFSGQNFGAGQYDRVKRCAWVSSALLGSAVTVLIAIFCLLAQPLFRLFTPDPEVIDIGVRMLLFLTPAYITYFLIEVIPGVLRGCGDVLIPTLACMFGICLIRVLWLELVVPRYHTLEAVMLSYTITWSVTSVFFLIYFIRGKWLQKCIHH